MAPDLVFYHFLKSITVFFRQPQLLRFYLIFILLQMPSFHFKSSKDHPAFTTIMTLCL